MRVGEKEVGRNECLCRGRKSCAVGVRSVALPEFATVEICMIVVKWYQVLYIA